jgi:hypothetical protein
MKLGQGNILDFRFWIEEEARGWMRFFNPYKSKSKIQNEAIMVIRIVEPGDEIFNPKPGR